MLCHAALRAPHAVQDIHRLEIPLHTLIELVPQHIRSLCARCDTLPRGPRVLRRTSPGWRTPCTR